MALDYTLLVVLAGISMVGLLAGVLGVFVLLRGQSLLGDAISHAALPGIALAFLITHSKSQLILLVGGAFSGAIGMVLVTLVTTQTRLKKDAAQGMVLSIFFGLGLVLLTVIQKQPISNQSVLNKFLFGNVSTLLYTELYAIAAVSVSVLFCIKLFWKELVAYSFDPLYVQAIGFGQKTLTLLLSSMLLLAIVVGLQSVGVILMSTMLIAPAAAARQWTSSARAMALLSGFFGAFSGVVGVFFSSSIPGMPTGPMIVVVASGIAFISLAGASYSNTLYAWGRAKIRAFKGKIS